MHITIIALGSRGDIVPYVTLGTGLRVQGHQVRVATFEGFQSLVVNQGLDSHPIQGDAQGILTGPGGQTLSESGRNPLRMARSVMRTFGAMAEGYARDLSAPELWKTDLIINQLPGGLCGADLAEKVGVPSLAVPFLFDQFYWGRRIATLGVDPEPVPHKQLSAEQLAEALVAAANDGDMRHKAAELGKRLMAEDGVARAVQIIVS